VVGGTLEDVEKTKSIVGQRHMAVVDPEDPEEPRQNVLERAVTSEGAWSLNPADPSAAA